MAQHRTRPSAKSRGASQRQRGSAETRRQARDRRAAPGVLRDLGAQLLARKRAAGQPGGTLEQVGAMIGLSPSWGARALAWMGP
jgi:hypothetical protein